MKNPVFDIFRYDKRFVSTHSSVIQSGLCQKLPETCFHPSYIEKKPSGELEVKADEDFDGCVCIIAEILSSDYCQRYIFHLFAYLKETDMSFGEFFGFTARHYPGELFQYYLLLVERYLQLLLTEQAEEGEEPERLMDFSDDREMGFLEKKEEAQTLLNLLSLVFLEFRENADILPILYRVIDLFIKQFRDAFFLAFLADFSESGFDSLFLVDNIFEGMAMSFSQHSFRSRRLFQNLESFKNFPISSYFTTERLGGILTSLLTSYCDEYSAKELHKAILNVTAFVIKKLPFEAAMEALNHIFTGLEKQAEKFQFILEAILVIVKENIRGLLEAPAFPIHPDESLNGISDYLGGDFVEKYKSLCKQIQSSYPKEKLKELLKTLSEKCFVAGIIFARFFNKSYIERRHKFALNADVCGRIQVVIEHSKILSECKGVPKELQEHRRDLMRKFPEGILESSGCGIKTTIYSALEHLRILLKKKHDARQVEWKKGGVASQRWDSRFDRVSESPSQYSVHDRLSNDLSQIDALISELEKHCGFKLLKDVQDENTKEIERVNAEIRVFDDQKQRIRCEHERLIKEAKKSILDSLFSGQQ